MSRRDPGVFDSGVRTEDGDTLGHTAIRRGVREHVETLAAQERCHCWNLTNRQSWPLEVWESGNDKLDVEDCSEELLRQQSYAIKNQLVASKAPY